VRVSEPAKRSGVSDGTGNPTFQMRMVIKELWDLLYSFRIQLHPPPPWDPPPRAANQPSAKVRIGEMQVRL